MDSVHREIEAIARMIEAEADATCWPEEADRLRELAQRVRARKAARQPSEA
jgi:hypothetical protein